MTPNRPLKLLGYLILICWVIYAIALLCADPKTGRGIYRKWEDPEEENEYLSRRHCNPLITGFAFSLTSAFSICWEELRLENWLARLNPWEYKLRANGLLRVVSAIQTLQSLYLIVLFLLTYFGRPFE